MQLHDDKETPLISSIETPMKSYPSSNLPDVGRTPHSPNAPSPIPRTLPRCPSSPYPAYHSHHPTPPNHNQQQSSSNRPIHQPNPNPTSTPTPTSTATSPSQATPIPQPPGQVFPQNSRLDHLRHSSPSQV
ncbi:hypothetical protein BJ508DRAFT_419034 [Ascobolus immersus RN42]|uniref:Uncharacterized protein n=1 Tax=Ascobolus immersus RN42 TaxID=1160509 RepID=A0A3N4HHD0_ASCIM|nr:hypothetical protein BJ508DRAFT_419034 [Ascobolus immersus RN42]